MCSRYRLVKDTMVITINGKEFEVTLRARYNVGPAQKMPVILPNLFEPVEMKWGWQPVWSKTLLINAQAETVQEKPTFKKYIGNRCLIPADGFYEWTSTKQPIMFTKPHDAPFCFAGLWLETTTKPHDVEITERKYIILTTTPNTTVGKVHNRMPFIVKPDHYGWWLKEGELYQSVLNNPDKDELQYVPVQRELNNVRNEGPELIKTSPIQKGLI